MSAIDDTIQVKRRIIEDLRPTLLDNLGIGAALKWQCSQFSKRWGIPCRVEMQDDSLRLSPAYSIAFYRVVQEALTNISKYALAKNVSVSLLRDGDRWMLRIADDGVGIDTSTRHNTTAHGLVSMRERARALGGEFTVQRPAGTRHRGRGQRPGRKGTGGLTAPAPRRDSSARCSDARGRQIDPSRGVRRACACRAKTLGGSVRGGDQRVVGLGRRTPQRRAQRPASARAAERADRAPP